MLSYVKNNYGKLAFASVFGIFGYNITPANPVGGFVFDFFLGLLATHYIF